MNTWRARAIALGALLLVSLGGCSTQARWVDCDGRLEPINPPAAKGGQTPARAPASKRESSSP